MGGRESICRLRPLYGILLVGMDESGVGESEEEEEEEEDVILVVVSLDAVVTSVILVLILLLEFELLLSTNGCFIRLELVGDDSSLE